MISKKAIPTKEKYLEFAAFSGFLIASLVLAVMAYVSYGEDFRGYYAAGRVVLAGENPYDYKVLAPVLMEVTGRMGNNPFYYPPWFAWFFAPIAWLPFETARAIWMGFNLLLWVFSIRQLSKFLSWPEEAWHRNGLFLLATLVFAWITWKYEQTGIVVFAVLIGVISASRREQWSLVGVLLALFLLKPNVTLLPFTAIMLWFIVQGNWKPVIAALVTSIVLMAAATLATPQWYAPFFQANFGRGLVEVLDGPGRVVGIRLTTTMLDWLASLYIGESLGRILYGLAILVGISSLLLVIRRSKTLLPVIISALLVSFAITPYAMQYDYPPLTLVFFWGLSVLPRKQAPIFWGTMLSIFIFSVVFWQSSITDGYWILVGLIGLTIQGWRSASGSSLPTVV
jgi:alpha-1,2-mannosyltransferase